MTYSDVLPSYHCRLHGYMNRCWFDPLTNESRNSRQCVVVSLVSPEIHDPSSDRTLLASPILDRQVQQHRPNDMQLLRPSSLIPTISSPFPLFLLRNLEPALISPNPHAFPRCNPESQPGIHALRLRRHRLQDHRYAGPLLRMPRDLPLQQARRIPVPRGVRVRGDELHEAGGGVFGDAGGGRRGGDAAGVRALDEVVMPQEAERSAETASLVAATGETEPGADPAGAEEREERDADVRRVPAGDCGGEGWRCGGSR